MKSQHTPSEPDREKQSEDDEPMAHTYLDSPHPLTALLSQTLVAFTIEFDNEFEHQMPHRTSGYGSTASSDLAPWLTSLVMWPNCMQHVNENGVTVQELRRLARTETNLDGMRRWGYITIEPDTTNSRSKQPRPDAMIRPTRAGQKAQEIWRPLFGVIEERWHARFGNEEIDQLRASLWALASQDETALPDCLPILGYGLYSRGFRPHDDSSLDQQAHHETQLHGDSSGSSLPLSALLARVLLGFAIAFEHKSQISLAISANVVRILDEEGVRVRDLPLMSGISKEAINMALGFLEKNQYIIIDAESSGTRAKVARLTTQGRGAQETYHQRLSLIEERAQERFGKDTLSTLREVLERLVGEPTAQRSPLFQGLTPYPDGWRIFVRQPQILPHYPMVLHRGGYPDGS